MNLVTERATELPVEVAELWRWHGRAGAFERLCPPWQRVEVLERARLEAGSRARFRLRMGPIWKDWVARVEAAQPAEGFVDVQETGPMRAWRHEHRMEALAAGGSRLTERAEYCLPAGLGRCRWIRQKAEAETERFFGFRSERLRADMERSVAWGNLEGKRVLISGMSGLIGGRLADFLRSLGCEVAGLSRGRDGAGWIPWDPGMGVLDPAQLENRDVIFHLAGESIAGGRWHTERKRRIRDSRVDSTRLLVESLREVKARPAALVCASGVNYYPFGSEARVEGDSAGSGFLAEVCRDWETEAQRAEALGVRTVCLRTGVVLDPAGGALGKMLPAFRAGLGGRIGGGRQGFPWIGMDDLLDIYVSSWLDTELCGAVNAVAPEAVDNAGFTRVLGDLLGRPTVLPVPGRVISGLLGQMGRETLLADLWIRPEVLERRGHRFRHGRLADCLRFVLGRRIPEEQSG